MFCSTSSWYSLVPDAVVLTSIGEMIGIKFDKSVKIEFILLYATSSFLCAQLAELAP